VELVTGSSANRVGEKKDITLKPGDLSGRVFEADAGVAHFVQLLKVESGL